MGKAELEIREFINKLVARKEKIKGILPTKKEKRQNLIRLLSLDFSDSDASVKLTYSE